jgi:hypothetical protein
MSDVLGMLVDYQGYIILGLAAVVLILLITVIVLFKSLGSLEKRYRKFMRGTNNKNIEELVIDYLNRVDEVKNDNEKIKQAYSLLDRRIKGCIQRTSMIRYRAFEDVGGDLSFSVALLDENNSGTIITGIFGRHESTTYAKPIEKGLSRYDLSEEEKQVLADAMSKVVV